jgi:hypothetical protein
MIELAYCAPDITLSVCPADITSSRVLFVWLIRHQPAVLFSENKPATSNQLAVLFSQNKSASVTSKTNRLPARAFQRPTRLTSSNMQYDVMSPKKPPCRTTKTPCRTTARS